MSWWWYPSDPGPYAGRVSPMAPPQGASGGVERFFEKAGPISLIIVRNRRRTSLRNGRKPPGHIGIAAATASHHSELERDIGGTHRSCQRDSAFVRPQGSFTPPSVQ